MKVETRKEEIIKTSTILFQKKGYSAVTMRDIAKVMGIKAASLYNHIDSKQEILSNIIISLAEEFTDGMRVIMNSNDSSIDKLSSIVKLHVDITSRNTSGMASLNNDWMHLKEDLDYYLKLRLDYEDNIRQIIEQGILNDQLQDSNAEVMLFSMLSTLRSLYIWIPSKEDLNPLELAKNLNKVLLTGIIK
ncbi:TetR/AcrR family transcriptional regulator [Flavivirga sp. 57AJ16]|uniref:TetR/AcrR family transcriptional regulator n=1 Tax=Flavivirga sp. 57AJ16 TaxID=3025307 RepID=UPI002366E972|nr:TetR/AcrR family transcriptional regulator [Flavivirga sp. 57AJ16]MDD7887594.1 TetR/AcrR family transcriptional regulator [Flavivirga sp. 57AJ16]